MVEADFLWSGRNYDFSGMTFPKVVDPDMGETGGFGNPVAGGAFHSPANRCFQVDLMPHRNEYRFAVLSCSENGAQGVIV